MATVEILYWQDIPSQVRVEDGSEEVKLEMPPRFQELIDQAAALQGLVDADDYLLHWRWSEPEERSGSASEVAEAVRLELEQQFPA